MGVKEQMQQWKNSLPRSIQWKIQLGLFTFPPDTILMTTAIAETIQNEKTQETIVPTDDTKASRNLYPPSANRIETNNPEQLRNGQDPIDDEVDTLHIGNEQLSFLSQLYSSMHSMASKNPCDSDPKEDIMSMEIQMKQMFQYKNSPFTARFESHNQKSLHEQRCRYDDLVTQHAWSCSPLAIIHDLEVKEHFHEHHHQEEEEEEEKEEEEQCSQSNTSLLASEKKIGHSYHHNIIKEPVNVDPLSVMVQIDREEKARIELPPSSSSATTRNRKGNFLITNRPSIDPIDDDQDEEDEGEEVVAWSQIDTYRKKGYFEALNTLSNPSTSTFLHSISSTTKMEQQRWSDFLESRDLIDLIGKDIHRLPCDHHFCFHACKNIVRGQKNPFQQEPNTYSPKNKERKVFSSVSFQNWFIRTFIPRSNDPAAEVDTIQAKNHLLDPNRIDMHNTQTDAIGNDPTIINDENLTSFEISRDERGQVLSELLFVYAKEHDGIGYRQGMHEILSYILLAVEIDWLLDFHLRTRGVQDERLLLQRLPYDNHGKQKLLERVSTLIADEYENVLIDSSNVSQEKNEQVTTDKLSAQRTVDSHPDVHSQQRKNEGFSHPIAKNLDNIFDYHHIKHDAFHLFEAVMYHLAPAYEVLETKCKNSTVSLVPSYGRYTTHVTMIQRDDLALKPKARSMSIMGKSILNHIQQIAGDEDLYHFVSSLSVPPELYCTRWVRLMFSREVVGWENVLTLWDFFLKLATMGTTLSKTESNSTDSKIRLMDVLECASAAMILLARNQLISNIPSENIGHFDDPSEKVDFLVNYPPMEDTANFMDNILFLIHQLFLSRKRDTKHRVSTHGVDSRIINHSHFASNPIGNKRDKNQTIAPLSMLPQRQSSNSQDVQDDFFQNRDKAVGQQLKHHWKETWKGLTMNHHNFIDMELGSMRTAPRHLNIHWRDFQEQSTTILKNAWGEVSNRVIGTIESIDQTLQRMEHISLSGEGTRNEDLSFSNLHRNSSPYLNH